MKASDKNNDFQIGNAPKKNPFTVPEGYFDTFADRLNQRIEADHSQMSVRTIGWYLKPALSIAASVAVLLILVSAPLKHYFQGYTPNNTQQLEAIGSTDTALAGASGWGSELSDEQILTMMKESTTPDSEQLSTDHLADYIAANYNEYEIISGN